MKIGGESMVDSKYINYKLDNGILIARYTPDFELSVAAAKICVNERLTITGEDKFPVLIDGRQLKSMDKAARDYLSSTEGSKGLKAAALLTDNPLTNFMANFFVKVNVIRSPFPIRLFTKETEALKWLERYKDK